MLETYSQVTKETASATSSDDDSSVASAVSDTKSTKSTSTKSSRRRGKKAATISGKWQDNPCPHCKKYKRRLQHPHVSSNDCFWNKKYKGWRPKWICDEMEICYTPRHKCEQSDDE